MELLCQVQNYAWGKKGSKSTVANLMLSANNDFKIEENLEYAELWMGTHKNAPSVLKENGFPLQQIIGENPQFLGENVRKKFGLELPFLFKVLSIDKALSIQAHPSKKHAEELHKKFPDIYKDSNHKPELAIALTPFEALCGFRQLPEIIGFITDIPELTRLTGNLVQDDPNYLQKAFRNVFMADKAVIASAIDNIMIRFATQDCASRKLHLASLVERLNEDFPGDVGVLMVYFLNYVELQPSEAIYLAANEPHAYISGDCIECMACSDNVVRAGLTPKFIDVDTLCSMLVYKGNPATEKLFKPIIEDDFSKIFKPPVPDFSVAVIKVPVTTGNYSTIPRNSASILLTISGSAVLCCGKTITKGTTIFLPANEKLDISVINEDLVIYQALANV